MTEQTAYMVIGIMAYFVAYELVGITSFGLWKLWAWKKVGAFWEYTLHEGLRAYNPEYWRFVRFHNYLYSVVYVIFWPVMVPLQIAKNTRALLRVTSRDYHF